MLRRFGSSADRMGGSAFVAITIVVAVVAVLVGVMSAGYTELALVVAVVVLVLGIAITDIALAIAVALAASLLMARVGGALSVADVALVAASVTSIFLLRGQGIRSMAPVLWSGAVYLAAILPAVILNPYAANVVEWVHVAFLVLGSLVVGFVIARSGRAQFATGLYVLACVGIAIAAFSRGLLMIVQEGRFGPVYLPTLDKNLIGCALAAAVIILYGRPAWFRLSSTFRWLAIAACGLGIAASGSRQAMVGLAVGLVVIGLRRHPETGKFPKLPWMTAVLIIYAVWGLVTEQLESGDRFNSANQRLDWYGDSIDIWLTSPIFGVGLRWWYTDRFDVQFQPPNLELEQLTTVGVVGLVALLAVFATAFISLWRIDPWYGTVGAAVVAARFVESQFDLHWVAGQASFLWIVTGICFGALERERRRASDPLGTALAAPSRVPAPRARPIRTGSAKR